MRHCLTALLLVIAFAVAFPVASQTNSTPAIDAHAARVANEVSHEIMSPFCPGKTLAMCPSPAAAEVRMKIQGMAESGMDEQQIKNAVIEEHGEEFRIVEPPWGDNVGLLVVLGGGLGLAVLIVVFISRRRGSNDESEPATSASSPGEGEEDPYLSELRKQYKD